MAKLRRDRDTRRSQQALDRLEEIARGDENTLPAILECVESHCTLGENMPMLRRVFGEHRGAMTI